MADKLVVGVQVDNLEGMDKFGADVDVVVVEEEVMTRSARTRRSNGMIRISSSRR